MLRIRINIVLAVLIMPGLWACAPRQTPAPVVTGGYETGGYVYPRDASGGIVVQTGDTLYAISRYHQTALQALIEANSLEPPYIIKPGQVLKLPDQPQTAFDTPAAAPQPTLVTAETPPLPAPVPATPRQNPPGAVTIGSAAASKPQASSGIENKPRPAASGAVVLARAPGSGKGEEPESAIAALAPAPEADKASSHARRFEDSALDDHLPPQPRPAPQRRPINHEKQPPAKPVKMAAVTPAATALAARPASRDVRFLWPASGPILSDFGPKSNGLHNDGINIAMPPNGPVMAAGDGIVSYAGNGLRGYGNLLLIRHEGGWVTAYAHNSELLVDKGTRVRRGQIIARAGRSGGVSQDQLHFEVRQGVKAVDPKPLLVGG
jgi:murein DD-endopeptidase MepM/ murein hydrolase activator NlpD